MNSLFLAATTIVLAQGIARRDGDPARLAAMAVCAASALAFVWSLCSG